MTTREALEPCRRPTARPGHEGARHQLDVGFLWDLVKALPVAEEVAGDDERSKVDIMRPLALINDLCSTPTRVRLGEALRPIYVDYSSSTTPTGTDPTTERALLSYRDEFPVLSTASAT